MRETVEIAENCRHQLSGNHRTVHVPTLAEITEKRKRTGSGGGRDELEIQ